MQNIGDKKAIVVESIKKDGPSLPSGISKQVELSLLFTSALLSEMVADKTLKLSYLKIGGSPLYYLPGQEEALERFITHLNSQEKESFEILKERRIVSEDVLSPVNRVAMRAVKDFAYPLTVNIEGKERSFWRLYSVPLDEAKEKIQEIIDIEKNGFKKTEKKEQKIESTEQKTEQKQETSAEKKPRKIREKKEKIIDNSGINPELKIESNIQTNQSSQIQAPINQQSATTISKPIKINKKLEEIKDNVKIWLRSKHIEIIQENEDEDAPFVVSTPSTVGNLKLLIVFSDKKKISEADVSIAYQKGVNYKMPVLFVIKGELNKKAQEYLGTMGGYVNIQEF